MALSYCLTVYLSTFFPAATPVWTYSQVYPKVFLGPGPPEKLLVGVLMGPGPSEELLVVPGPPEELLSTVEQLGVYRTVGVLVTRSFQSWKTTEITDLSHLRD